MLHRSLASSWRALFMLSVVAALPSAQAQRLIGTVTEVRPAGDRCRDARGTAVATFVTLLRGGEAKPVAEPLPQPLVIGDQFTVAQGSDTRLRINDATFGHGVIVLAPQLLCGLWASDTTIAPVRAGQGRYKIDSLAAPRAAATLRLTIESGGAFVQWDSSLKYRLRIVGGTAMTIAGTEIVVVTDASGNRGFLYVRTGAVTFDAFPPTRAGAGELYELSRGAPPRRLVLSTAATDALRNDVDFHSRDVWTSRPPPGGVGGGGGLLRNPLSYLVVGGAGYGVWRLTHRGTSPSTSNGQVTVRIPL